MVPPEQALSRSRGAVLGPLVTAGAVPCLQRRRKLDALDLGVALSFPGAL